MLGTSGVAMRCLQFDANTCFVLEHLQKRVCWLIEWVCTCNPAAQSFYRYSRSDLCLFLGTMRTSHSMIMYIQTDMIPPESRRCLISLPQGIHEHLHLHISYALSEAYPHMYKYTAHAHKHTYIYIYICIYIYKLCIYVHTYTYTYTHEHTHIQSYKHMNLRVYTCHI